MMIKSWHKYNESLQELTREMVVDVIYYRNFTFHWPDINFMKNRKML